MRTIRIGGRRLRCRICKHRYATISFYKVSLCSRCLRAFFLGHMIGRNAEADLIYSKYDLIPKKEDAE